MMRTGADLFSSAASPRLFHKKLFPHSAVSVRHTRSVSTPQQCAERAARREKKAILNGYLSVRGPEQSHQWAALRFWTRAKILLKTALRGDMWNALVLARAGKTSR